MKKIIILATIFLFGQVFAQSAHWEEVESDVPYFVYDQELEDFLDDDFVDSTYFITENDDFFSYAENIDLEFDEGDFGSVTVNVNNVTTEYDDEVGLDDLFSNQNEIEQDIDENITRMKYRSIRFNFVKVDRGFFYGDNNSSSDGIFVDDFEICQTEVTQKLYMEIMEHAPSQNIGKNLPVERVNWFDAVYFCNQLSIVMGLTPCYSFNDQTDPKKWKYNLRNGKMVKGTLKCNFSADGFRLPTEVEWEYAARGGQLNRKYKYSGSDDLNEVAWNEFNSSAKSHEIAQKKPNDLGIFDMSGNVWEWCWDSFKNKNKVEDIADLELTKVVKGGGFDHESYCSLDYRESAETFARFNYVGFRICRSKIN